MAPDLDAETERPVASASDEESSQAAPSDASAASRTGDDHAALQHKVDQLQRELEAERLRNEIAQLRGEIGAFREGSTSAANRDANRNPAAREQTTQLAGSPSTTTNASAGAKTLAYWNRLNDIIAREASTRSAPAEGLSAANAADFLSRRTGAGRDASNAIRELDSTDIAPEATALADKLAGWYDANASAADNGGSLLNADAASRRGQPGRQYQSSERGLQESVAEINREGERVRASMTRKYGLEFPPLR